ncbi:FRG domain-containing protein [Xanthomonas perforans]
MGDEQQVPGEPNDPTEGDYGSSAGDEVSESSGQPEAPASTAKSAPGVEQLLKAVNERVAAQIGFQPMLADINRNILASIQPITARIYENFASQLGPTADQIFNYGGWSALEAATALANYSDRVPSLTRASDYADPDRDASPHSDAFDSPASYYAASEGHIDSFEKLNSVIATLIGKAGELPLVWRGAKNAEWGLQSSLYRRLSESNGVKQGAAGRASEQPYPDEDQMVRAEREMLSLARGDWRFDAMSALETFARIQHAGGPTRLIDVTKNPYIAAWFAVEDDPKQNDNDARLFAIATKPVARDGSPPPPDSVIQLDELGDSRMPFWHGFSSEMRQEYDWGTGARRRVWVPPSYDPRISAQNAAFIIDGVPIVSAKTASSFRIEKGRYWTKADLLASASIYAKFSSPTVKPRFSKRNFAPTFSFRITASAKKELRDVLEARFGYTRSYIYPDMAGLADHLKRAKLA